MGTIEVTVEHAIERVTSASGFALTGESLLLHYYLSPCAIALHAELEQRVEQRTAAAKSEIAARIKAEEQLRSSEERLKGIIGSAMDTIITVDDQQRIALFNAAAEKMFRCSASDAVGQSIE